jgi:hypothetical protein
MPTATKAVRPSEQLAQMALTQLEPESNNTPVSSSTSTTDKIKDNEDSPNVNPLPETLGTSPPELPPRPLYSQILSSAQLPSTITADMLSKMESDLPVVPSNMVDQEKDDPMEDVVESPPYIAHNKPDTPPFEYEWGKPPPDHLANSAWSTSTPNIMVDTNMSISKDGISERMSDFPPLVANNKTIESKGKEVISDSYPSVPKSTTDTRTAPAMTFGKQEDVTGKLTIN